MFRKYEFPRNKKIDCSATKIKNNRITKNTKKKQKTIEISRIVDFATFERQKTDTI